MNRSLVIICAIVLLVLATPRPALSPAIPVATSARTGAPHVTGSSATRAPSEAVTAADDGGSGVKAPARWPAAPRYSGTATWYCGSLATCTHGYRPGDLIGAIDRKDSSFRQGDRVTVRAFGRAVTVTIVDSCACGGTRLIDLSRAAFARLADPDLGVIPVSLELAGAIGEPFVAPLPTAPRSDTEGGAP